MSDGELARLLFFVEGGRIGVGDAGMTKKNRHWGTTLDAFLDEDGIREVAKAEVVTRVVAWQLREAPRPQLQKPGQASS